MRIIEEAALSAILNGSADNETHQIMLHAIQERDEMESKISNLKKLIESMKVCLNEAIIQSCATHCGNHPIRCTKTEECNPVRWCKTIAKAAGEEANNGND